MENEHVRVYVYDAGDRLLLKCSIFELLERASDTALLAVDWDIDRASYARVAALGGSLCIDVEAPPRE